MELQHVNIKIPLESGSLDLDRVIEIFHRWVAEQSMPEMLIDVADYRHVFSGPSVVLIGLQADYSLDNTRNRLGLRYNRKANHEGSSADRIQHAFRSAAQACRLLEGEFKSDGLKFSRREFELMINDRQLAPNCEETLTNCEADIRTGLQELLGHDQISLEQEDERRRTFGVTVQLGKPFELDAVGVG